MNILSFYRNNLLSYAFRLSLITHHPSPITHCGLLPFALCRVYCSLITHHSILITVFIALCCLTVDASASDSLIKPETTLKKVAIRKQIEAAHTLSGGQTDVTFLVEVIRDMQELKKGLSGRESMHEDHGMLFVLNASQENAFWMKDMQFPLDIIFIGGNMQIIEILENLQPCKQCPVYFPKGQPAFALEINAGLANKRGIALGDTLVFDK